MLAVEAVRKVELRVVLVLWHLLPRVWEGRREPGCFEPVHWRFEYRIRYTVLETRYLLALQIRGRLSANPYRCVLG